MEDETRPNRSEGESSKTRFAEQPVKRSVTIAGHPTSLRLEPIFWELLDTAALKRGLPLNALIARIDAERLDADDAPLNLASALRVWIAGEFTTR